MVWALREVIGLKRMCVGRLVVGHILFSGRIGGWGRFR